MKQLKDDRTSQNGQIKSLKEEISKLKSSKCQRAEFIECERNVAEKQQYIRRNNIEVSGIHENIVNLEDQIISIGKAANIEIKPSDIEACHRLKSRQGTTGPRRVIARFTNRKICEALLSKSKSFKNQETFTKAGLKNVIYINSNLCGYYKFLWGKAKYLFNQKSIYKFWIFNGTLNIKVNDQSASIKITHLNDLVRIFPGVTDLSRSKFSVFY